MMDPPVHGARHAQLPYLEATDGLRRFRQSAAIHCSTHGISDEKAALARLKVSNSG